MLLANKEGIPVIGQLVNLAAAGLANAVAIFTLPALAGQLIGTKSLKLRKVHLYNNAAGNQVVLIGTGVGAGVALMPGFDSMNNLTDIYDSSNFPEFEFFATIVAWPVALLAGSSIDIQVEVAVCG